MPLTAVPMPVGVEVLVRDDQPAIVAQRISPTEWEAAQVVIEAVQRGQAVDLFVTSEAEVARVIVRFEAPIPATALVLGDAWERAYGDLHWGPQRPERVLPWFWAWHERDTEASGGMGVALRPGAFCAWSVDGAGASLWLDLHNGGEPVRLGGRKLAAATVVATQYQGKPNQAVADICAALAADVQLRNVGPVIGANNWYYAYGVGFGPDAVLNDAQTIAELSSEHDFRPISTVDYGWQRGEAIHQDCDGPWVTGTRGLFEDMAGLAQRISDEGCRPGLWVRPASLSQPYPGLVGGTGPASRTKDGLWPIDLTVEENIVAVERAITTLTRDWKYELIKYDFTFFDSLGRHGREITGVELTEPGWHHADRSLTNAEVFRNFYDRIRTAAGDAVLLGCGVAGHLAAGSIDVQRIGCDTSGRHWERTRRMGLNSLAFRQPQDRTFYVCDPDCVPSTPATPWELNRQFLDVVASTGTALFVSIDPTTREQVSGEVRDAITRSLSVQTDLSTAIQPVDVLETSNPKHWVGTGGEAREYQWLAPIGAWLLPTH